MQMKARFFASSLLLLVAAMLSQGVEAAGTTVRINAGGPAYTDSNSNLWSADNSFSGSTATVNWGSTPISGTSDPTLFRTEHYGGASFQYALTVPNGTYTVNLSFAENYVDSTFPNGGVGYRVFSVQANGTTIISNLDVFAQVGAHAALTKTATVTVSNGQLVLSSPQGWFVNAIEVIQQGGAADTTPPTIPSNLNGTALSTSQVQLNWTASTDAGTGVAGYHVFRNGAQVGSTNAATTTYTDTGLAAGTQYSYTVTAYDLASPANESAPSTGKVVTTQSGTPATVIRINAAGQAYTDTQSHVWSADTAYSGNTATADWGTPTIANTTDPTLFRTERYGANLQYSLSLPNGTYQVNLYFAENYVNSTFPNGGIGYRVFNVQANGATIVSNLDLMATAGAHVAVIKSATVTVNNGQLVLSSDTGWFVNAIEVVGQSGGVNDSTPPTVPGNVTATAQGSTSVQVNWSASTDAGTGVGGYHVFRNGTQVGTVSTTSFLDTGRSPGTTYSYNVTAFDNAVPPNESAQSSPASATTSAGGDVTPPTVPTNLAATALNSGAISLSWGASTDAGTGLGGYHVLRGGSQIATIGAGTTTYTDSGLNQSTTYRYTVTAFDLASPANESAASNAASATTRALDTTPPTVPNNVSATALSTTQIQVSWSASSDSGTGISGYRVSRDGSQVGTTGPSTTTFTDSGLSAGTQHSYTVVAVDGETPANVSAPSSPVLATTLSSGGSVLYRINAGGSTYNDSASNTWSADANYAGSSQTTNWGNIAISGTSDPTLYRTERYGQSLQYAFNLPNGSYLVHLYFAENYVDSTFPNGGVGFRVFSVQANGNTILSNIDVFSEAGGNHKALIKSAVVAVTNGQLVLSSPQGWFVNALDITAQPSVPDNTPPTTPTSLGAQAVSGSSIQLSWNASSDSGSGVAGYHVFRNGSQVGTANSNSYTDTGLSAQTTYYYNVTAFDLSANESGQSNQASATTTGGADTTPPTTPGNLQASSSGATQITLSWQASTDSGSGIGGYKIYRGGSFRASTVGTSTNFIDSGLSSNTNYSYQVTAYDVANNESGLSNTASASTGSVTNSSGWQLKDGSGNTYVNGSYGTPGVPGGNPGSRYFTVSWSDNAGRLYVFGGAGSSSGGPLNDLWRYDPNSSSWTWLTGSNSTGDSIASGGGGSYGNLGQASPSNTPGRRRGGVQWKDAAGNLYMFGGNVNPCDNYQFLNDLWEYVVGSGQWVWLGGSSTLGTNGGLCPEGPNNPAYPNGVDLPGIPASYGNRGVESSNNWPGGRSYAVSWTDSSGNFWMFGGVGYDAGGNAQQLNDLWRFNVSNHQWTWMTGNAGGGGSQNFGQKGVASPSNVPGPRQKAQGTWADSSGNLYLFGGYGPEAQGANSFGGWGPYNDLWKYNISSGLWTWIGGSNNGDTAGHFGQQGQGSTNNMPGARNSAGTWVDASGNFWLFGGFAVDINNTWGLMNDLWKYQPSSGQWTWVDGSAGAGAGANYNGSGSPGGRTAPATFVDSNGSLWMYGGNGYGYNSGLLGDLWKY